MYRFVTLLIIISEKKNYRMKRFENLISDRPREARLYLILGLWNFLIFTLKVKYRVIFQFSYTHKSNPNLIFLT